MTLYSLITAVDDPAQESQLADLQLRLITEEKVTHAQNQCFSEDKVVDF